MPRPFHLMWVMPPQGVIRQESGTAHGVSPAFDKLFSEGMWIKPRTPRMNRERTEGERPVSGSTVQRWEAVFRRERRPVSLDRALAAHNPPKYPICGQDS